MAEGNLILSPDQEYADKIVILAVYILESKIQ